MTTVPNHLLTSSEYNERIDTQLTVVDTQEHLWHQQLECTGYAKFAEPVRKRKRMAPVKPLSASKNEAARTRRAQREVNQIDQRLDALVAGEEDGTKQQLIDMLIGNTKHELSPVKALKDEGKKQKRERKKAERDSDTSRDDVLLVGGGGVVWWCDVVCLNVVFFDTTPKTPLVRI